MSTKRVFAAAALCLMFLASSRPAAAQYSITDLGAINGGADSSANRVNSAGHIVGGAYDADGLQHAVMWINGNITDLGTLCPSCGAGALGVNDNDQVVGFVMRPGNQAVGFIYTDGTMSELSPLPGDAQAYAYAINNQGIAVGQSVSINGTSSAVRWVNGVAESLGNLGGPFGAAFDINDQNQIVGYSGTAGGGVHGFFWAYGTMTDLGGPNNIGPCGDISGANGINANGVVVGYSVENCSYTGFTWFNGQRDSLPQLAPNSSQPYSMPSKINDNGDIVGNATNNNGATTATLWHNGAAISLGAVVSTSLALDINEDGLIVGRSQMPPNGFNERGVTWVPLPADTTPPVSTLTAQPSPNANGWYQFGGPSIQIQATDVGQGVQSITYTLTGAQNESNTFFGSFASFSVFNPGITTVTYYAADLAGNVEAPHTFTVRIDGQQPIVLPISNITVNATSAAGASVTFAVNASDSISGIASTVVSPKTSGSVFPHGTTNETVTVTDNAGNVAVRTFTVTVNKSLVRINVNPSTATVNVGQGQQFQAQGVFTDGSTLILNSSSGGGGGGGGGASTSLVWNVHFDDFLNVGQCTPNLTYSSQAFGASTTFPATVSADWGTPQAVHVSGSLTGSQLTLTLTCTNGQGSPGSLVANWTGTRYEGTWNFSGSSGHATIRGWSSQPSAPTARFSIGAATVNGVVYVMGNNNPGQASPVEAYDIANNSWSTVSTMPVSREGASYAALNGKIYAAGGHVSGGGATATVDVYDPSTNSWAPAAAMSIARAQFALVATGGKLYAIGGETGANGSPLTNSVEVYDPSTDSWTARAPMAAARKFHVAGAMTFSTGAPTIVVAGGIGTESSTEFYNIPNNAWGPGVSPVLPISGAGAVVINNAMFVIGGTANGGSTNVTMFRPGVAGVPPNPSLPAGWTLPGVMISGRGELAVAAAGGSSDVLYAIGGLRNGNGVTTVEAMSTPPPFDLSITTSGGGGGGFVPPTVSWSSNNPGVAGVNSNGQAQSNGPGQAMIIATAGSISCQSTGSCGILTVMPNQPPPTECAHVVLTVTAIGSLPFSTINLQVEGDPHSNAVPFGQTNFDIDPGSYTVHFSAPAGYHVTPDTVQVSVACGDTAHVNVTVQADDTTPPVLTLPSNITVPAGGPSGATVSFAATAIDAVDGPRPVVCLPASGSLFASGVTTTVNCSASDTHGNTANGSFTVTVLSGSQLLAQLIGQLGDFKQGVNLLNNAQRNLANGDVDDACSQIKAFMNQVSAQSGKKLTPAKAAQLTELATQTCTALGCS